jgi:hypothetical protein
MDMDFGRKGRMYGRERKEIFTFAYSIFGGILNRLQKF